MKLKIRENECNKKLVIQKIVLSWWTASKAGRDKKREDTDCQYEEWNWNITDSSGSII